MGDAVKADVLGSVAADEGADEGVDESVSDTPPSGSPASAVILVGEDVKGRRLGSGADEGANDVSPP